MIIDYVLRGTVDNLALVPKNAEVKAIDGVDVLGRCCECGKFLLAVDGLSNTFYGPYARCVKCYTAKRQDETS